MLLFVDKLPLIAFVEWGKRDAVHEAELVREIADGEGWHLSAKIPEGSNHGQYCGVIGDTVHDTFPQPHSIAFRLGI